MTASAAGRAETATGVAAGPAGTAGPARLTIPVRFNGPPGSAHGGYVCGRLAELAAPVPGAPVSVTLLGPPPLGEPMEFRPGPVRSTLWSGPDLVATVSAAAAGAASDALEPVSVTVAQDAADGFLGSRDHPFPTCFACGPRRGADDGLLLRPGPVPGTDLVACVWQPTADGLADDGGLVLAEFVWSVLDCPGGWTRDPRRDPAVLSRMTARVGRRPRRGDRCVVVGRMVRDNGRSLATATALYDAHGLVATASAVWTSLGDPVQTAPEGRQ